MASVIKHVCIVGARGAGKTTFANALLSHPVFPSFSARDAGVTTEMDSCVDANSLTAMEKNICICTEDALSPPQPFMDDATCKDLFAIGGDNAAKAVPLSATRVHVQLSSSPDKDDRDSLSSPLRCSVSEIRAAPDSTLPANPLIIGIVDSLALKAARRRSDISFGVCAADAAKLRQSGIVLINLRDSTQDANTVRIAASTFLGVESRRVFACDLRSELARALVPALGAAESIAAIRQNILACMHAGKTAARHRIEAPGASTLPEHNSLQQPDRYVPKVFAETIDLPAADKRNPTAVPTAPTRDAYVLKSLDSARFAAELLTSNSYVPLVMRC
jgi:hypothetical protein